LFDLKGRGRPRPFSLLKNSAAAADTTDMNRLRQLPKRTQIMAAAGVVLILAVVALKELVWKAPANVVSPPLVIHHHPAAAKKPTKAPPKVDPSLPAALRTALARHPVVVAILFSPAVPGDSGAVTAARQGASSAHVGFAALDVHQEWAARTAALKLAVLSEPSVVVIRRPGTVSLVLPGYEDAQAVAQAASDKP
jgi:hypothetical protein